MTATTTTMTIPGARRPFSPAAEVIESGGLGGVLQWRRGFSMLELMVAMTITLIITGAMYGFITQSSSAFTKEPALADRQQQIRIAMDRIQNDIVMGGMNLGRFFQTFTPGLNAAGGALGVAAAQNHDILEIKSQGNDCPPVRVCPEEGSGGGGPQPPQFPPMPGSQDCGNNSSANDGVNLNFVEPVPSCYPEPGFAVILYGDGNAKDAWGHNVHGGGGNEKFNFPPGQQPPGSQVDDGKADLECSVPAGGSSGGVCPAVNKCPNGASVAGCAYAIVTLDVIRYQIGIDPADGAPALFRSTNGGLGGAVGATPAAVAPPGAGWQLIARGIEDMQVRYRTRDVAAAGTQFWSTVPPAVAANPDMIVREVEITLWARAVGLRNIAGETLAANGVTAVRGSMTMRVTPRAALDGLIGAATNRWQ